MVIFLCVCFEDLIVKIKEFSTVSYPIMATDKRSHHGMQAYTGKSGNQCSRRKIVFDCPEIKNMASFNNDPRTI